MVLWSLVSGDPSTLHVSHHKLLGSSVAETCREQPRVLWTPRAAEVEVSEHSRTKKGQGEQQPPAGVCRLLPRDASLPTLSLNTPCQASAPGRQRRKQQTEKKCEAARSACCICICTLRLEKLPAPDALQDIHHVQQAGCWVKRECPARGAQPRKQS